MNKIIVPAITFVVGLLIGALVFVESPRPRNGFAQQNPKAEKTSEKAGKKGMKVSLIKDKPLTHVSRQNAVKTIEGRHFTLITGRVVRNGEAYPNCQLYLADMNPVPYGMNKKHTATIFDKTDSRGRFLFSISNGGRYLLGAVKREGASPFTFKLALEFKNKENSVRDLGDVDVTLGKSIYGQVADSTGKGLPSISVIARIDKKIVLRTLTGPDGTYRLGFIDRKEDVEVLFVPRPPFKKHLKAARVFVKPHDSPVVDQVLEVNEPKSFSRYVFVYTKLNRPKDPEFGHGPSIELFQDGKHLSTRTMGHKEGFYNATFELELGEYLMCIKQGNSLRIGKYVKVNGDEFISFELTEYDVIPTRKITVELNLVEKRPIPAEENYLKVGFPRPKSPGVNNPTPRYLMSLAGGYNEIEVPMNMPLVLKHNRIDVDLESNVIGPNQRGLMVVNAQQ